MDFGAKDIDQGNGVIDIGESIDIFTALIAMLVRRESKCLYQQFQFSFFAHLAILHPGNLKGRHYSPETRLETT